MTNRGQKYLLNEARTRDDINNELTTAIEHLTSSNNRLRLDVEEYEKSLNRLTQPGLFRAIVNLIKLRNYG